ncbi:MAG: asparagine synthase-related protein, partial [bacterium]
QFVKFFPHKGVPMHQQKYLERVVDLTDGSKNIIYNMNIDAAKEVIKTGHAEDVRKIDGQFALVTVAGKTVRIARSIGRPVRYFIAKLIDGPCLVVAERINEIYQWLKKEDLDDQFHPSYTRMAPAHYITELALLGCPDPNPTYSRFFTPERNSMPKNIAEIGKQYIGAVYNEIAKWLQHVATEGPVGVSFSGGVDSGSVFLLTYHAMLQLGMSPSRLKAFTLSIEGGGADLVQAQRFLQSLGLALFHEPIEVAKNDIDWQAAVRVVEDYKPLDIQAAAMNLALCKGIRARYPDWRFLLDGDGGDENLKDYPIEENPELTIRSVLNNLMLYQEGWGVDSIKHSLTYSGGLSRGYARTSTTAQAHGFEGFSPYTLPNVIEISEAIPFIELTDWQHNRLYGLKGKIVAAGVQAITGFEMPVFEKRRFQHGVAPKDDMPSLFPANPLAYRRYFNSIYE